MNFFATFYLQSSTTVSDRSGTRKSAKHSLLNFSLHTHLGSVEKSDRKNLFNENIPGHSPGDEKQFSTPQLEIYCRFFFAVHSVAQPLRRFFACKVVEINANCVDSRLFSVLDCESNAISDEWESIFHTKLVLSQKYF